MTKYDLTIEPEARDQGKRLPGHMRQRIAREIRSLALDPRPSTSRELDVIGLDVPPGVEMRRIRLDNWRVIYAVNDEEQWVWVFGVQERPPYDYEDLDSFAARLR